MTPAVADGVSSDGVAVSLTGSPSVGPTIVGCRNTAATSTRDATATRFRGPSGRSGSTGTSSSAGANAQSRTALTTAWVNGGVLRSGVTASTRPPAFTTTSTST